MKWNFIKKQNKIYSKLNPPISPSSSSLDSWMNFGGLAIGTHVVVDVEVLGYHLASTWGLSTGFIQRPSLGGWFFCFLGCGGCGAGGIGTPWKTNLWLAILLLIPLRLFFLPSHSWYWSRHVWQSFSEVYRCFIMAGIGPRRVLTTSVSKSKKRKRKIRFIFNF